MSNYLKRLLQGVFFLGALLLGALNVVFAQEQNENQTIQMKLMVPDTTWTLSINEVYQVGQELWVIAEVKQMGQAFGLTMITTLEDQVTVKAPALPAKYYVMGKTWGWVNEEPYTFIKSKSEIEPALKDAKQLFSRSF